jgi:hypothetical protein
MPVSANSNVNTKQSYVPPSLRNKNTPSQEHRSFASSAKKNELKKEFSLADEFPTLGETIKTKDNNKSSKSKSKSSSSNNSSSNSTTTTELKNREKITSFSSIASTKVIEKKDTTATEETKLLPGWVYIRKNNTKTGTMEYKYVESTISQHELELAYQENERLGRILFKYRIAREQYQRDMDVERLGDLSEFYGEPTLIEMYENDSNLHFNEDDMNFSDNDY